MNKRKIKQLMIHLSSLINGKSNKAKIMSSHFPSTTEKKNACIKTYGILKLFLHSVSIWDKMQTSMAAPPAVRAPPYMEASVPSSVCMVSLNPLQIAWDAI